MSFELRYYQNDAKRAIEAIRAAGGKSAAACLPTGTGKSALAAAVLRDWPCERALFVAHTKELIRQNADEVAGFIGERPCIEMAEQEALPAMWGSKVVVASVSTLYQQKRLAREVYANPSTFGLVVWDECHHAVKSNKKYQAIKEHFADAFHLGLTATLDRTDKQALKFFDQLAYDYKLSTAIDEGFLVPIRQKYGICQSLDYSRVRVSCGDFNEADQESLMLEEKPLLEVAEAIMEKCPHGRTLVFCSGIHHAERLTEILQTKYSERATCVHGGNKDYACPSEWRDRRIKEFDGGVQRILLGCDVFYEGFNVPGIANVVIAKKTKSRLRYAQAVGRGTRVLRSVKLPSDRDAVDDRRRLIAASDKPFMTVVDLVGCSTQLELELPCVADLLLDGTDAAARARAKKKAIAAGGSIDAVADVREAEAQIEREKVDRERREAIRKATEVKARFDWVDTGGIGLGAKRNTAPVAASSAVGKFGQPATANQLAALRRNGVDGTGMTKGEAGRELDRLFRDRANAAPTESQTKMLASRRVQAVSREHASALIDLMIGRNWAARQLPTAREDWGLERMPDGKYRALVVEPSALRPVGEPQKSESECRNFIGRMIAAEQKLASRNEAAAVA